MLLTGKSVRTLVDEQIDYLRERHYEPTLITMSGATLNHLLDELDPIGIEAAKVNVNLPMQYRGIPLKVKNTMNYRQVAVSCMIQNGK